MRTFPIVVTAVALGSFAVVAQPSLSTDSPSAAAQVLAASQRVFDQLAAGTVVEYTTEDWEGVDLFGRPMYRSDFQDPPSGEEPRVWRNRDHFYDKIEIVGQDARLYGQDVAVVRTHAMFFVTTDGQKLKAELRILDVFRKLDGQWLLDLTQATSVGQPQLLSD